MPTNKILFMSTKYFKDNTVVNDNVDNELIEPFILTAQNVRIESVIGTGLFNEIKTEIMGAAVSADNKILLNEYILPALKEWTTFESLPFLNYKLTNKAVSKKNSDNSDPSELNELIYLRNTIRNTAEYMSQRLTNFLKENTSTYPLYSNPGTGCDVIRPNSSSYFNGLYIGKNN